MTNHLSPLAQSSHLGLGISPSVSLAVKKLQRRKEAETRLPSSSEYNSFGIMPYPCKILPREVTTNLDETEVVLNYDGPQDKKWYLLIAQHLRKYVTVTYKKYGKTVCKEDYQSDPMMFVPLNDPTTAAVLSDIERNCDSFNYIAAKFKITINGTTTFGFQLNWENQVDAKAMGLLRAKLPGQQVYHTPEGQWPTSAPKDGGFDCVSDASPSSEENEQQGIDGRLTDQFNANYNTNCTSFAL
eukprot:TRINITY_DN67732_c7_g2_i1.p1 TRINITY_DN67732_c7_g2~~TRINITY_DN67732_c7_g2_i1.p1  ORF type:complete len:242 (-),score=31.73 TRINITY_DN67732_c7_g2_i1:31-756(-)